MYKIQFIGSKNIEFASKWKQIIEPLLRSEGKYLGDFIAKNGKYTKEHPIKMLRGPKDPVILTNAKARANALRRQYKIDKNPIVSDTSFKTTNAKGNQVISDTGKQRLEQLRESSNKRKIANKAVRKAIRLKKLGVGVVGLATLGGIGYGLIRKIRSDKGKKRK